MQNIHLMQSIQKDILFPADLCQMGGMRFQPLLLFSILASALFLLLVCKNLFLTKKSDL